MNLQVAVLFIFGIAALIARVLLAVRFPNPTPDQQIVFRTVLALSASGIAGVIPGMFDLKSQITSLTLSATGALGVFVLVYLFGPKPLPPPRASSMQSKPDPIFNPASSVSSKTMDRQIAELREPDTMLERQPIHGRSRPLAAPTLWWTSALLIASVLAVTGCLYFSVIFFNWPFSTTDSLAYLLRTLFAILAGTLGFILPGSLPLGSTRNRLVFRTATGVGLFVIVYAVVSFGPFSVGETSWRGTIQNADEHLNVIMTFHDNGQHRFLTRPAEFKFFDVDPIRPELIRAGDDNLCTWQQDGQDITVSCPRDQPFTRMAAGLHLTGHFFPELRGTFEVWCEAGDCPASGVKTSEIEMHRASFTGYMTYESQAR
jgi:hypothetical protein